MVHKKTAVKKSAPKKVTTSNVSAVRLAKKAVRTKRRMLIVDTETPADPVTTASAAERVEAEKALVFPCKDCGESTDPSTRSMSVDGSFTHIGCSKKKPRQMPEHKPALTGLPKHRGAKVPVPPPAPVSPYGDIAVMSDHQGRTCIQVKRDVATVTYVPMDVMGFHLHYASVQAFDARYRVIEKYPVPKAIAHYVSYCVEYGATKDVLDYFSRVIVVTEEQSMAARKKLSDKSSAAAAKAGSKPGAKSKVPGEKKESASGLFKSLIMEGKHTDEEIFAKVKAKFGLDDKKRAYVAWYRNHLKKSGANPPEPKGVKKEKPEAKKVPAKKEKGAKKKKAA